MVISQLTLRRNGPISAMVINSGNANACTGPQGFRDALRMATAAAEACDADPSELLVCSTGVIGRPMPTDPVTTGLRDAARSLSDDGGDWAAQAIMTTDTVPKTAVATHPSATVSARSAAYLTARIRSFELAYRMQTAAPEAMDVGKETQLTQRNYGMDNPDCATFGRQLLLSRGLVDRRSLCKFQPDQPHLRRRGCRRAVGRPQRHPDQPPRLRHDDRHADRRPAGRPQAARHARRHAHHPRRRVRPHVRLAGGRAATTTRRRTRPSWPAAASRAACTRQVGRVRLQGGREQVNVYDLQATILHLLGIDTRS